MLGTTVNQTFNIFIGVGQNGKSVLVNLMENVLGDYKGDVPLTLVTDKRGKVGGLAPEIVQLKGVRFAVMQEPSKDDKINEGIMKQFTSGKDPIQGRAPYMPQTISFIPQFKLVVTANNLMKIGSNDHGTWRRIRPVPFESLFTENPVKDDPDKPFQFLIDKTIDEKFAAWKEVFAAMLIDRACITNGYVKDCDIVLERCKEYRKSQDHFTEFIQERIVRDVKGHIKKTELNSEFTVWYTSNNGGKSPSPKDLHEQMDKEFGRQRNGAWVGVRIKYDCNNDFGDATTVDDDEDVYSGEI
jgi:P4 family phage/plasmid primase-like protien